jgi:hypothetical protein
MTVAQADRHGSTMIYGEISLNRFGGRVVVVFVLEWVGKALLNRFLDAVQHERPSVLFLRMSGSEPNRTYLTAAGRHGLLSPDIHALHRNAERPRSQCLSGATGEDFVSQPSPGID